MDYTQKVINLIAEKTGVEPEEINEESYFEDDLNISELELIEILTDLEDVFNIEDLVQEKENIETVGDLLDLVADRVE